MKTNTIVIKLGTSSLTNVQQYIDPQRIAALAKQVVAVRQAGHRVVLVSSGAIAAGKQQLSHLKLANTLPNKQCFAAVGQCLLMNVWASAFANLGVHIGQLLLTRATIEDRERFLNARDAIRALLEHDIVPIVNENDSVATAEIKVGDNDNLASISAILAQANYIYLLTDKDGLYTADPTTNPQATLIHEIKQLDDTVMQLAKGAISNLGTGGMLTKLQAAQLAARSGITTIIAASDTPNIILRLANNERLGTKIYAQQNPIEFRKQWILGALKPGSLIIDEGAKLALINQGASLLPKGITAITGNFNRGDVVEIKNSQHRLLAFGVTNYNNTDLTRIIGQHSHAIHAILGYTYGEVAVHRDNMVLK